MMVIELKLASKLDKKPTINSKDIRCSSDIILIKFIGFSVYFHSSRDRKTYYAHTWEKRYGLPKVGEPMEFRIDKIIEYKQLELCI